MLRRVQCTFPKATWLAVVPVALVLVSCGGESLTGPSAVEPVAEAPEAPPPLRVVDVESGSPDDGVGEAVSLCRKRKVLICHKGRNKWVGRRAVRGHLRHGDTLGRCSRSHSSPSDTASTVSRIWACTCSISSPGGNEIDPASIRIGEPVRVVFHRVDDVTLPRWIRIDS